MSKVNTDWDWIRLRTMTPARCGAQQRSDSDGDSDSDGHELVHGGDGESTSAGSWGRDGRRAARSDGRPSRASGSRTLDSPHGHGVRTADGGHCHSSPGRPCSVDGTHGRMTPAAHSTSARRRNSMNRVRTSGVRVRARTGTAGRGCSGLF